MTDPRRFGDALHPYIVPSTDGDVGDLESGFRQLFTVVLGIAGLIMKKSWMSWLCLVLALSGHITSKFVDTDFKATAMTFGLSVTGILTSNLHEQALLAQAARAASGPDGSST